MTEERKPKYLEGDCRRNPNWKRETSKQRRARAQATQRYWTPEQYKKYCAVEREKARLQAEGHDHS